MKNHELNKPVNGSVFPHEPDFCMRLGLLDFASQQDYIVLHILTPVLKHLCVLYLPIAVWLLQGLRSACLIVAISRFYDHISPWTIRLRGRYFKCDFSIVIGQRYLLFFFLFVHYHLVFLLHRLFLVLGCYACYHLKAGDVLFWRLVYILLYRVALWLVSCILAFFFFILSLSVHARHCLGWIYLIKDFLWYWGFVCLVLAFIYNWRKQLRKSGWVYVFVCTLLLYLNWYSFF